MQDAQNLARKSLPGSVLFICYLNAIRSPMAEGLMKKNFPSVYAESCGIAQGDRDDLMIAVMKESRVDMSEHEPQTLAHLQDALFDVVISFTPDAYHAAQAVFHDSDTIVEHWPLPDPTSGSIDVRALMNNYRSLRDNIEMRLLKRFGEDDAGETA